MDLSSFLISLKETCAHEGYPIGFVRLYGSDCWGPYDPPDAGSLYDMVILSDAARKADYRSGSSDRIKDFHYGCTRWAQFRTTMNDEELENHMRFKFEGRYSDAFPMNGIKSIQYGMFSAASIAVSLSLRLKHDA